MKRLCPWKPHVKKGTTDSSTCGVPQHNGIPGWLLLTHDENEQTVAIFVDIQERHEVIPIVMDERLFSDSVFRVIRLKPRLFVACDIRWLNGRNIFETKSYAQRVELLGELLDECHVPDFTALCLPEQAPHGIPIRGHEYYADTPGSIGVFLPVDE